MRRVKPVRHADGRLYGYRFECPGCVEPHVIPIKPDPKGWDFSGTEERPTFAPSILVYESPGSIPPSPRCHSFVRDGRIEFLPDSTHALAGQTVDLPEIL